MAAELLEPAWPCVKPRDEDISRCPNCGAWRYHERCATPVVHERVHNLWMSR